MDLELISLYLFCIFLGPQKLFIRNVILLFIYLMAYLVSSIEFVIMNTAILDDKHALLSSDEFCSYHCLFTCKVVYFLLVQIQVYSMITKNEFPLKFILGLPRKLKICLGRFLLVLLIDHHWSRQPQQESRVKDPPSSIYIHSDSVNTLNFVKTKISDFFIGFILNLHLKFQLYT